MRVVVQAAVEGILDDAIARHLIEHVGGTPGTVYVKGGKTLLLEKLVGFNNAAQFAPWLVVVDLDGDAPCAPTFRNQRLQHPSALMCFRIAVREIETWLLADQRALAKHLTIPVDKLPAQPEAVDDPKRLIVSAVDRYATDRAIRSSVVPRPESGRETGPAYDAVLMDFVARRWRPERAAAQSNSLGRAVTALKRLMKLARSVS